MRVQIFKFNTLRLGQHQHLAKHQSKAACIPLPTSLVPEFIAVLMHNHTDKQTRDKSANYILLKAFATSFITAACLLLHDATAVHTVQYS